MALPSSILPSTTAEVLAEQDALKASSTFRRLPQGDLPSFIVSLTSRIANSPIDTKKLYSRNLATRQTYYNDLIKTAKTESSLLLLSIRYDKLDKLASNAVRVEYINRLSHLILIFMGKYNHILKDIPKTDIIANKLGKDVYFHLVKRIPSLVTLIDNTDPKESAKAFADSLYYIKSSVLHPLTRFISLLLGELSSSGSRPDIDKREFKREQQEDRKSLKEDFRKNKKFYKAKWSALRNEALATLSNLDIESSVSSNSSKTRDVLNERRARIDNFIYSLEQGIQSINNNSFEGFVSAKVSVEDSLIEYSKRLEFRTIARKARDIDEAARLKAKSKTDRTIYEDRYRNDWTIGKKSKGSSRGYAHGVLRHLGPAGLAMYAGYKLVNNPLTRTVIGKPVKYLGGKLLQGAGFLAKAAARKFIDTSSLLARTALSLVGRGAVGGLRLAGSGLSKAGRYSGKLAVRGIKYLSTKAGSAGASAYRKLRAPSTKKFASSLINKALYASGYGAGYVVRGAKNASGLLSKILQSSFSKTTTSGIQSRIEPDMSGMESPTPIVSSTKTPTKSPVDQASNSKSTGFPLELISRPLVDTASSKKKSTGFPLELVSRPTKLPEMKSGLSSPKADLYIDDILDRIDEHVPYIPADLTEEDFTLEDLKHVVTDALEEFLSGSTSLDSTKLSNKVKDTSSQASLSSINTNTSSNNTSSTSTDTTKLSSIVTNTETPLVSIAAKPSPNSSSTSPVLVELNPSLVDNNILDKNYESKLTELLTESKNIQEQLEQLDRHLDKVLAKQSKINPYDLSLISEVVRTKDSILESIVSDKTTVIKTIVTSVFDTMHKKFSSTVPSYLGRTEDDILTENNTAREERSDRSKLIRTISKISRNRTSKSSQTGGLSLGLLSMVGPTALKFLGPSIAKFFPKIARFAPMLLKFTRFLPILAASIRILGPVLAAAGLVYGAYKTYKNLVSAIDKKAEDASTIIDKVSTNINEIVSWIKSSYERLGEIFTKPIDSIKDAGSKLSSWWDSNPVSRGIKSIKNSISEKVSTAKTNVGSSLKSIGSSVVNTTSGAVDKISSAASGAKTYVSDSVGKLFSTNNANVDFDNLDPGAKSSFESMAKEYRTMGGTKPLSIESARRSTEKQAKLYAANPSTAAKPGRSLHERGKALDIDRATAGELESMGLLAKYGFSRDVKGEPWHISYRGQPTSTELYQKNSGTPKTPSAAVAASAPSTSSVAQQNTQSTMPTITPVPKTKTVSETAPTSTKPNYKTPSAPVTTDKDRSPAASPRASGGSTPINTFSFLDSSFFIMNAGMMAS